MFFAIIAYFPLYFKLSLFYRPELGRCHISVLFKEPREIVSVGITALCRDIRNRKARLHQQELRPAYSQVSEVVVWR